MATLIPRAQIPDSQLGALPRVQAPPVADLSPLARGAQAVGKVVSDFALQAQERNDTAALLKARRELSDFEASTFDPNNAEGIAKYRGQNALGAGELVSKADSRIGEIRSGLTPRQAAQFDAISGNFRDGLQGRLNSYMDREHGQFIAAETKASIDNLTQDAINAGLSGDFARQDQLGTELIAMSTRAAQVEGAGPEQIKATQRGIASNVRASTALGIAQTNPIAAQDYYLQHAENMDPADRIRVEGVLRPVVEDAEAQAVAQQAIAGEYRAVAADIDEQIQQLEGTGQNPNSSARGVGQFIDATWLETLKRHRPDLAEGKSNAELLTLKDDPALGRELLTRFREDNARSLTARGITPSAENLYAAHHFGVGGAAKFARAGADTPMSSILSPKELRANPYLQGKTVGEVKANWAERGLRPEGQVQAVRPPTEADAIASVQGIKDPRFRKQVVAHIRDAWAIRDAQERENDKALAESAYTAISANTDPRKPLRDIIGPEAYAYAVRKGSLDTLDNYRRNVLTGHLVQDDVVLADALHREAVLSPNTFRQKNLYGMADRLSTGTLQDLLKMQTDIDNPSKRTEWATTEERIQQGYLTLGIDPAGDSSDTGDKRQNQRAGFAAMYRAAEKDFVQRYKTQPTPEQADRLLRNVERAAAQLQSQDKLGQARGGAALTYGQTINETERAEIVADFRAMNDRDPTEAEIVNVAARFRLRGNQ